VNTHPSYDSFFPLKEMMDLPTMTVSCLRVYVCTCLSALLLVNRTAGQEESSGSAEQHETSGAPTQKKSIKQSSYSY
jgi:hypothetical protein